MLWVVIGITYGALIGLVENWVLFHQIAENKRRGLEPLRGVGAIFLVRYLADVVFLFAFGYVVRHHPWAIVAAGLSLTVAVKVSLFMVYARKGGRFG